MFKGATRIASSPSLGRVAPILRPSRRFISTAPPHQQSRSWKSSAARWGLAGALVYYYNTSTVFADEPAYAAHAPPATSHEQETYTTVESIAEQRKAQARPFASSSQSHESAVAVAPDAETAAPGLPEELEEEASQQGAFNEETGEINWDCPCLGGMAYGPCGEQFRAAFSCFVFSKSDPKGVDCIEHFKGMQDCFREHPDVYGSELDDDDEAPTDGEVEGGEQPVPAHANATAEGGDSHDAVEAKKPAVEGAAKSAEGSAGKAPAAQSRTTQEPDSKPSPIREEQPPLPSSKVDMEHHAKAEQAEDSLVPKAAHDAR